MVPAIMILTFAWALKAMTDSLGAAPFVEGIMQRSAAGSDELCYQHYILSWMCT